MEDKRAALLPDRSAERPHWLPPHDNGHPAAQRRGLTAVARPESQSESGMEARRGLPRMIGAESAGSGSRAAARRAEGAAEVWERRAGERASERRGAGRGPGRAGPGQAGGQAIRERGRGEPRSGAGLRTGRPAGGGGRTHAAALTLRCPRGNVPAAGGVSARPYREAPSRAVPRCRPPFSLREAASNLFFPPPPFIFLLLFLLFLPPPPALYFSGAELFFASPPPPAFPGTQGALSARCLCGFCDECFEAVESSRQRAAAPRHVRLSCSPGCGRLPSPLTRFPVGMHGLHGVRLSLVALSSSVCTLPGPKRKVKRVPGRYY